MVAIMKLGRLQLCIDPKDLNRAIKHPKYQMLTLEELLPTLSKAKIFTVLDTKDGFHHVQLEKDSYYLTSFWTPFDRYQYLCMPNLAYLQLLKNFTGECTQSYKVYTA